MSSCSEAVGHTTADELLAGLARIVGADHVLTDADRRASYETDWTGRFSGQARCVVRPADTAQVSGVVAACAAAGACLVPQGGNTGLVGAGVPRAGEVVVSLGRLDRLEPVDTTAAQVTAGAGVTLAALHAHAEAAGLAYGVDFAARDSATVGGSVATNAGGLHVVRHGDTRAQVLGVEAVLADGRVVRRLGGLPKDSTGYDLPGLLTGSEGTLAVVTSARLRLRPLSRHRVVALLGVESTGEALDVLAAIRGLPSLSAVEWFHDDGLRLVRQHSGLPAPLPGDHPTYVLVECAGPEPVTEALAAALDGLAAVGDVAVAEDRRGRSALWAYRERHTEAVADESAASNTGPPHKLDVAVPLTALGNFEVAVRRRCAEADARVILFGHLAEGNLHVNVLGGNDELDHALLLLVAECGGSISAEHGVGIAKAAWLPLVRDAADRAAMLAIKRALDPQGLLNPGVLFAG